MNQENQYPLPVCRVKLTLFCLLFALYHLDDWCNLKESFISLTYTSTDKKLASDEALPLGDHHTTAGLEQHPVVHDRVEGWLGFSPGILAQQKQSR